MKLNELSPSAGQKKKGKRLGRGVSSGKGGTSGRGHKGYNSRSGGGVRPGFEGGQMPLHRRLPKRGFTNIFKVKYCIINIKDLEKFKAGDLVNKVALVKVGLIKNINKKVKLLGNGDLDRSLDIHVDKISKSASDKVKSAGGKVEEVL